MGAGALGTWAGIGLGLAGEAPMQLTIYDPDGIEATNLNRQVLFAGDLYRPKAEVLAERLSTLFPKIDAEGRSRPIFS